MESGVVTTRSGVVATRKHTICKGNLQIYHIVEVVFGGFSKKNGLWCTLFLKAQLL